VAFGPRIHNPFASGGTQRLETLADGVFSIVMTLLVFEITPPKDKVSEDLGLMLLALWPNFLAFLISVGLVGIYWSAHRSQFLVIRRTDHGLNWLNVVFLAIVSLLPFSTRVLANYHTNPIALALYAGNLSLVGVSLLSVWLYATVGNRLVDKDFPKSSRWYGITRSMFGAVGYAIGAVVAFWSTSLALLIFAVVPLFYILPPLQRVWIVLCGVSMPESQQ
jgi:uncharacterized membrane protein